MKNLLLLVTSIVFITSCGGGGGGGGGSSPAPAPSVVPAPAPQPAPTVSVSLSASQVEVGEEVTITYSSSNANSCEAKGSFSSIDSVSGTQTFSSWDTGTYNFELTCSGAGGSTTTSQELTIIETFPEGINNRGADFLLNYSSVPSVAINHSGRMIGIHKKTGGGGLDAVAQVYEWVEDKWIQKGSDINSSCGAFCSDIEMSGDGLTVALADAPGRGKVLIYKWDGVAWTQKGADLVGEGNNDDFGDDVALSSNGDIIVIGAIDACNNGCGSGSVYVYEWDGNFWNQKGLTIDAERDNDHFGTSVDINDVGNIFVAAASLNNNSGGTNAGHARIFEWTDGSWTQKGSDIDGSLSSLNLGTRSIISSDGNSVAISGVGGYGYNGRIYIYTWDGTRWSLDKEIVGNDVAGESRGERLGVSLDVDKSFNTIVSGSGYASKNIYRGGAAKFFNNDGSLLGSIDGDASEGRMGGDVAINKNGSLAIIAAEDLVKVVTLNFDN